MATFAKQLLSGSTQGKQIKIAATATPGTLIHTSVSGTTNLDEIWLFAINTDTVDHLLTIEWGEVTSPDGHIVLTIPSQQGLWKVIPGLLLQNSLIVRAYAAVANTINISGFVNNITP